MIEAHDLRIGNWVSFKGLWNGKVREISEVIVLIQGNKGVFPVDVFSPIPLTPELLMECGFEADAKVSAITGETILLGIYKQINDTLRLHYDDTVDKLFLINIPKESPEKDFYVDSIALPREVKYLHQLQNAFHVLTGQELQISKP